MSKVLKPTAGPVARLNKRINENDTYDDIGRSMTITIVGITTLSLGTPLILIEGLWFLPIIIPFLAVVGSWMWYECGREDSIGIYDHAYSNYQSIRGTFEEQYAKPLITEIWGHIDYHKHYLSCDYCKSRADLIRKLSPAALPTSFSNASVESAQAFLESRELT